MELRHFGLSEAFHTLSDAARNGMPVRIYTTFGQVFDGIPTMPSIDIESPGMDETSLLHAAKGSLRLHAYRKEYGNDDPRRWVRRDGVEHLRLLTAYVGAIVPLTVPPANTWYDE